MMACKASTVPLLRNIAVRSYSAAQAQQIAPGAGTLEQTVLDNKLVVASVQNNSPLARVSILFRAGSRYENPNQLGLSHALRCAAGLTTVCESQLAITRNLQKLGANLTATGDRESITYTLEGTRNSVEIGLKYLREVATQPAFKPWEISDNLPRIEYEIAGIPAPVRAVELLHQAAFRTGLGNSIFVTKSRLSGIKAEALTDFVCDTLYAQRTAVSGVGIDHGRLIAFAQDLPLESGEGPSGASPYRGGEVRKDVAGELAHVAIGTKGAALKDTKNALAFAILQQALGAGPAIRWGSGAGILSKAVNQAAGNTPVAITALNAEYSDAGLIGALVSCPADQADKIVKSVASALKSANVTDADVKRGKALLKTSVLSNSEDGRVLVEEIGQQALLLGQVQTLTALAQAIDTVSTSDVAAAAKQLSSGKMSVGAIGNLSKVPYLDEL